MLPKTSRILNFKSETILGKNEKENEKIFFEVECNTEKKEKKHTIGWKKNNTKDIITVLDILCKLKSNKKKIIMKTEKIRQKLHLKKTTQHKKNYLNWTVI